MPMPLQKAQKVISEYRKANFNATKGLVNAGYAKDSATKQSKKILESALKKVTDEEIRKTVNDSSLSPRNKILQMVGMSEGELINEYMFIVKQNKDLTNKLKAMLPLLKTQGIVWEDNQTTVNPTLNLTVKSNSVPSDHAQNIVSSVSSTSADHVSDHVSNDVENGSAHEVDTAQQSHIDDRVEKDSFYDVDKDIESFNSEGGGVDIGLVGVKEEESPTPKNVEKDTIDINQNL